VALEIFPFSVLRLPSHLFYIQSKGGCGCNLDRDRESGAVWETVGRVAGTMCALASDGRQADGLPTSPWQDRTLPGFLVRLVAVVGSLLFQRLRLCCSCVVFLFPCRPQRAHDHSTFRGRDRHAKGLLMRNARGAAAWNDGRCVVRQTCLDQELGAWRPWKRGEGSLVSWC
jgi:hypothetical protein